MSKRTTIFLSLLALITALLSVLFIIINVFVDVITDNSTTETLLTYARTTFDLIADYTAYGILIYSFSRFDFKKASRSIWIALGSFVFSITFLLIATGVKEYFEKSLTVGEFWLDRLFDTGVSIFGLLIERILPCALIILISFICTKNGTSRITKLLSFKNPIQRAMLFSSITIYLVNFIPYFIIDILKLIAVGGTKNIYFEVFFYEYITPHIVYIVNHLFFTYIIIFITYFICKKFEESAPIKRKNTSPLEEK